MSTPTASPLLVDLEIAARHLTVAPDAVDRQCLRSMWRVPAYAILSIALMFTSGCGYSNLRAADGKHYITINRHEYNIADVGFVWLPNAYDTGCSTTNPSYFATALTGSVSVYPSFNTLPLYNLDRWMAVIPGQWKVTLSGIYGESRVIGQTYHTTTYETKSYRFTPQIVTFGIRPLETVLVTCEVTRAGLNINQVRRQVTDADFNGCYFFACKMGNERLQ
jgi:hypothetical protein